ncbi:MAG: OmpH family outer membrane protein [Chitinophagales bacterium]|nr:OmpH family outer membrane protein [Chitinophagales bacterium]
MKKLALGILLLAGTSTFAQQKIGHLNSSEILQALPEYKQMSDAVEKKKGEYAKVMETMYSEYEKKAKDIQDNGDKMTQLILDSKVQEVKDLEKRIGDFEQKAQSDLQSYAQELMKPLNDKYLKGVKEVAKENGYAYILDIAAGGVVYFPETGSDVTPLVKAKIGATLPVPSANTPKPAGTK